jgi:hypothetical protein
VWSFGLGCDALNVGYADIGDILKDPTRFDGKEVKIKGEVADVLKVPFVETKIYSIKDGTGKLLVVTSAGLPAMGAQVRVRGTIQTVAIIGGQSLGLHLTESERW